MGIFLGAVRKSNFKPIITQSEIPTPQSQLAYSFTFTICLDQQRLRDQGQSYHSQQTPHTMTFHELTFAQVQGLLDKGSMETCGALIKSCQPHLSNPLITCLICIHPYHSANVEGNIEEPVITACGHIFGNSCLNQWLTPGSALTCPLCRFVLQYKECGHVIKPLPAFSKSTPPKITAEQTPDSCSSCELRNTPWQQTYNSLLEEKEDWLESKEELCALESCIEDLEKNRPEMWKTYLQTNEQLAAIEGQLAEAKACLDKERKSKEEEIEIRGGWHL
jgi:hypothetical protein